MNRISVIILCIVGVLLFLSACRDEQVDHLSGGESSFPANIPHLAPERIELGELIYAQHCASCHGSNLEGEANWKEPNPDGSFRAPPHDASGHTWHHGDIQLIEAMRLGGARIPANFGISNMPAYEGILTEGEMSAVLDYIKSTWSDELRQIQWQQTLQTGTP
jgi:S-disulfanyl-L-cysteine oxidoreductase SoxD